MIDIKLKTFLTIAKTKNFTRAAEILNITQPAVSQHIKALEDYYNVSLLCRKGKQMDLSPEGEFLFEHIIELDRLSKMIKLELNNKTSILKKYNVGATLTIGGYVLPKIIGQYKKLYKNMDIILHVENTESIMKKLFNGDVSLAVIEGPFNKNKVKYSKFRDDELVLVVSPDHDFASREEVAIEEVLTGKLILREVGSGTRKIFENKVVASGFNLDSMNIYMEIGNINALVSLVESNLGYTIISKEAIKSSLERNSLKIVPIKDLKIIREFNFVYLDDIYKSFIDNFIKFCQSFNK